MLELADVLAARDRVAETARETPLEYSNTYSTLTGADVRLKLENFQRTGSFKIRGATNKIAQLNDDERERGVVTASAGNHAQGVALAASQASVDAGPGGGERHPLGVVAGACGHDAALPFVVAQPGDFVGRAADLERAGALEVLQL